MPKPARDLCDCLAQDFTKPNALRFSLLIVAALLTIGSPTVANLLRTLGALVPGESSSYRRFFWQRRWSSWRLAKRLTAWILLHLLADGSVILVGCVDGGASVVVGGMDFCNPRS
ncbi:MAG: transposase [Gemmataceae bacterium]